MANQSDKFELPLITIEFVDGIDEESQLLALEYWDHDVDIAGRVAWRRPVSEIADEYNRRQSSMASDIGKFCIALSRKSECESCGTPLAVSSRTSAAASRRPGDLCDLCTHERDVERKRIRESDAEHLRDLQRRKQGHLHVSYAIEDMPTSPQLDLSEWDFIDVLGLDVLLNAASSEGIIRVPAPTERPLSRDLKWLTERLKVLRVRGVIDVHPATSIDAFIWEVDDESDELSAPSYYPTKCAWYLVGRGPLAGRVAEVSAALSSYCRNSGWPMRWLSEIKDVASDLMRREAQQYFEWAVDIHDLPQLDYDRQVGELAKIVDSATSHYSLGQCYSVIWSVAKDGAAVTQRHPAMPRRSATMHTLRRIGQYVDKALDKGWALSCFREQREIPLAVVTVRFFELLSLSPLEATIAEVEDSVLDLVAFDRRTEARILLGVTVGDFEEAILKLDGLRTDIDQANLINLNLTPHDWLLADSMRRLPSVLDAALEMGCNGPDAYRSVYVGAELLGALGSPDIVKELRAVMRDSVSGSLDAGERVSDLLRRVVVRDSRPDEPAPPPEQGDQD